MILEMYTVINIMHYLQNITKNSNKKEKCMFENKQNV